MDPVPYYSEHDRAPTLIKMISELANGGPPIEVWGNGSKVAVIITPEEFDLLNRLIRQEEKMS